MRWIKSAGQAAASESSMAAIEGLGILENIAQTEMVRAMF